MTEISSWSCVCFLYQVWGRQRLGGMNGMAWDWAVQTIVSPTEGCGCLLTTITYQLSPSDQDITHGIRCLLTCVFCPAYGLPSILLDSIQRGALFYRGHRGVPVIMISLQCVLYIPHTWRGVIPVRNQCTIAIIYNCNRIAWAQKEGRRPSDPNEPNTLVLCL